MKPAEGEDRRVGLPSGSALSAPARRAERPVAHRIASDAEAIEVARDLAPKLAAGAVRRDRERILPWAELDATSSAGLWAMTVPRAYGGAEVSYATVAKVFAILAAADPSVAQIQQNHTSTVFWLSKIGTPDQRTFFLGEILRGARCGNATAEPTGPRDQGIGTRIERHGADIMVHGRKSYCTGALFADFVTVIGLNEESRKAVAIVPAGTPGLTIIDDWASFGQRVTASGTVIVDAVTLPTFHMLPIHRAYEEWPQGAVSQITHAAIDAGIARAAIDDAIAFIRQESSPPLGGTVGPATQDPHLLFQLGELKIRLHAAEAMLDRGGHAIDEAILQPDADRLASASIAVAEAKALTSEIALSASSKLFELAGTKSTQPPHAFDRHWRNARVHTLHDPVRWKYSAVGDFYLNGTNPPRGGQI